MINKRSVCWIALGVTSFAVLVHAAGLSVAKNSLYGDPAHPNIAGMWNPEFAYLGPPLGNVTSAPSAGPPAGAFPPGPPPMPQLTPRYAKRFAEWKKKFDTDGSQEPDSVTRCLAFGMPRFGSMPVEIIQTPGQVTMNLGVLHDIRRIYLDGVGHTVGADPSFNGDSVGRWVGDTLIVDTNNIRSGTLDRNGVPYSDKLTAVEKFRRVSADRLEIETTLTDPEAFVAPFTMKRVYVPMPPRSRFEEYICENNKDI